MVGVAGAVLFAGYQLMVYGLSQIQGDNAGFFDILWPGRFTGAHKDTSGSSSTQSSNLAGIPNSPAKTQLEKDLKLTGQGIPVVP